MSCDDPRNPCDNSYDKESLASMIGNLIEQLFGAVDKTIIDGVATWSTPCSGESVIADYPRVDGEGLACYLLRIISLIRLRFRGYYSVLTQYSKGDIVLAGDGFTLYVAEQDSTGQDLLDADYWAVFLAAKAGPTGPAGGSDPTWTTVSPTANYTVLEDDQLIKPSHTTAFELQLAIPQISSLSANSKWYRFYLKSSQIAGARINAFAGDTIGGLSSLLLNTQGESVLIVEDGANNWEIID